MFRSTSDIYIYGSYIGTILYGLYYRHPLFATPIKKYCKQSMLKKLYYYDQYLVFSKVKVFF